MDDHHLVKKLKPFLDEKYQLYNRESFIASDPVIVPHHFSVREDIEISGFLTATIAWGQRQTIISNALTLISWMDNAPYQFITGAQEKDFSVFTRFVHRTFNGDDCLFFLYSLRNIYLNHGGLEKAFTRFYLGTGSIPEAIIQLRSLFFEVPHLSRSQKHFADIASNAAAKRLNMFLRWMVRKDEAGVDFGLWNEIPASALYIPLDVHTGNVARKLGLLHRKQNDWKAVEELTRVLRMFDPADPIKYDYALFGSGIFEKFSS